LKRKTILTKEKKNKRRIKLLKIIYHKFGFKNENEKKKLFNKTKKKLKILKIRITN
jgi:hypothetical protein